MAAGKDEMCQFYQITRKKVVLPADGAAVPEKEDNNKDANNKGETLLS